ncbi:hypothetical protein Taro_048219 [Colocasia esculenta]|uniref:Uncharacterized protein n=1 Tax=Colocasia esculenta TaxID=4460 RepID=A0A843X2F6_COLES|nr:hypothetical protein [Colocasia esculenta]
MMAWATMRGGRHDKYEQQAGPAAAPPPSPIPVGAERCAERRHCCCAFSGYSSATEREAKQGGAEPELISRSEQHAVAVSAAVCLLQQQAEYFRQLLKPVT